MKQRILDADKQGRLVIGASEVIKGLKSACVGEVVVTPNCFELHAKQIRELASLSGVQVNTADVTNRELGSMCKRPFSISAVGLRKE